MPVPSSAISIKSLPLLSDLLNDIDNFSAPASYAFFTNSKTADSFVEKLFLPRTSAKTLSSTTYFNVSVTNHPPIIFSEFQYFLNQQN